MYIMSTYFTQLLYDHVLCAVHFIYTIWYTNIAKTTVYYNEI